MKKLSAKSSAVRDTMRSEYDFAGGVRGKYVLAYRDFVACISRAKSSTGYKESCAVRTLR